MLRVLATVVLVVSIVWGYEIAEFSEEAYLGLGLFDPEQEIPVRLVNFDDEAELIPMDGRLMHNAVSFWLDEPYRDLINLGIEINDENIYFDFVSFTIRIIDPNTRKPLSITIIIVLNPYGSDIMTEPILLEIPVFLVPAELAQVQYNDSKYFEEWAADHKLGLLSPLVRHTLKAALESGNIFFTFYWLQDLLTYNVYPSYKKTLVGQDEVKTYVTRPVIVSEDTKNVLIDIFRKFQFSVSEK